MTQSADKRFDQFLARTLTPTPLSSQQAPANQSIQMFVGSVGGDVFILGELPAGAVEIMMARRNGRAQQEPRA